MAPEQRICRYIKAAVLSYAFAPDPGDFTNLTGGPRPRKLEMKYRGDYDIKDLRRDLDNGLGWAHSTESVAKYLETIVPTAREAKIRCAFEASS